MLKPNWKKVINSRDDHHCVEGYAGRVEEIGVIETPMATVLVKVGLYWGRDGEFYSGYVLNNETGEEFRDEDKEKRCKTVEEAKKQALDILKRMCWVLS